MALDEEHQRIVRAVKEALRNRDPALFSDELMTKIVEFQDRAKFEHEEQSLDWVDAMLISDLAIYGLKRFLDDTE